MADIRTETDSMGAIEVPAAHYWGAQTQRSIQNFPIGVARFRWQPPVIRALGVLKRPRPRPMPNSVNCPPTSAT